MGGVKILLFFWRIKNAISFSMKKLSFVNKVLVLKECKPFVGARMPVNQRINASILASPSSPSQGNQSLSHPFTLFNNYLQISPIFYPPGKCHQSECLTISSIS